MKERPGQQFEQSLRTVYFFPVDAEGRESGECCAISLDGSGVSLEMLPRDVRDTLQAFGVPDELHVSRLYPKDGERFLRGLLRMTGPYYRFRSTCE